MNFVLLSGKVVREPRIGGGGHLESVWFRICVPNQDNPRQRLFISVRARGELAAHVWENVALGDEVALTGRIYSARMKKPGMPYAKQFVFVVAERVSSSYPVQVDLDSRFVRVRVDLWNRMTKCIEGMEPNTVPEKQRRELLAQLHKIMGLDATIEEEVENDRLDPDPSSNQDLP